MMIHNYFCDNEKDRVSSYKHLRGGVVFISEIPKSSSGKILRKLLVNM